MRTVWAVWTVHANRLPAAVLRAVTWTEEEARRQGAACVRERLCEGYTVTEVPLLEGGEVRSFK